MRLKVAPHITSFEVRWQGTQREDLSSSCGDFVLQRKDGLWAYQLAVVVDDHHQGINQVVRGRDLLDSTARQIYLQQQLGYGSAGYAHFPLIIGADGKKLSKQNMAPAIDDSTPAHNLRHILQLLKQPPPPMHIKAPAKLLAWSSRHWQADAFAGCDKFNYYPGRT
jgi:glutamyl-Q tRNA(Asp) synthetase